MTRLIDLQHTTTEVRPLAPIALPEGWKIVRAKHVFKAIDERSKNGSEELLSVSHLTGVTPRSEKNIPMFMAESYEGHKLCYPGDLVVNSIWAWMKALGFSEHHGIISTVYSVYRLREPEAFNHHYLDFLLRSELYSGEYLVRSKGVWTSRLRLADDDFFNLPILFPPRSEQDTIVAFLDERLADIDRYIAARQRLIRLLTEQKAAIINRAVTRGLNPDAPLKESGIEWLGKIPSGWEAKRAKYYFREINERSETGEEELLSVSHITGVTPRSQKHIYMFMAETYEGYKICRPGDLVINIMWAWMGAMGVSEYTGIVSSSYGVYRPKQAGLFRNQYLDLLLRTTQYVAEYNCRSTGITSSRLRMYTDDFFNIPILRPSIDDQDEILGYIRKQTEVFDTSISTATRQIELMQELRTALIAEAVTGKLDMRQNR